MRRSLAVAVAVFAALGAHATGPGESERREYRLLVASESSDEVHEIVFDGESARVTKVIRVGSLPTEVEGPHGLAVDPEGEHWFVSLAHGKPFGRLCKYAIEDGALVGEVELGVFPATLCCSAATGLVYVVNFDLHGRMLPSSVSVVDPEAMVEVARTQTGPMPHGSRMSPDGMRHYSCAMMSGHLFEIDAAGFEVTRRLQLEEDPPEGHESTCKPTWVQPHPKEKRAWVALNGADQLAEVDLEAWRVVRRLACARGPYNLELTSDGALMVCTYKQGAAIGMWDVAKGEELARLPTSRKVAHGVVIAPDDRFAFVSSEGVGAQAGVVDVVDLGRKAIVATVEVGLQAGGIALAPRGL